MNPCNCIKCEEKKDCIHEGAFRRLPKCEGGLGLCPKLKRDPLPALNTGIRCEYPGCGKLTHDYSVCDSCQETYCTDHLGGGNECPICGGEHTHSENF